MALIACVLLPQLAIAVARRDDPALVDTPLVLYAHNRQCAMVSAASADTGLAPGMSLRQAVVRCPNAVYRPVTSDSAQQAHAALVRLLQTFSPRVDAHPLTYDAQIDLDLGPITIGQTMTYAQRVAAQIQATVQLVPALGVAATRFVAYAAALVAGVGATIIVPAGEEAGFLAPHPITTLPIGDDITRRLQLLGLHTIGDLARLPLDALQAQFGALGCSLYQFAHGRRDAVPIATAAVAPTIVRRGRFAGPLTNRTMLNTAIEHLVGRLTTQLATDGWAAQGIVLTLTLEDGAPWIGQQTLSMPTADPSRLLQAFLALSRTANLEAGVEAVTLHVSQLVQTVATQRELFAPVSSQPQELDGALERLHARYASSFVRAQLDDPTAFLPEQRVHFEPWEPR